MVLSIASKKKSEVLRGLALTPGVIYGEALVIGEEIPSRHDNPSPIDDIEIELDLFRGALNKIKEELRFIINQVSSDVGQLEAEIFESHIRILEDSHLLKEIEETIQKKKWRLEHSIDHVLNNYQSKFSEIKDPLFQDKFHDLKDVLSKVKKHKQKEAADKILTESSERILVSKEIYPSLIPPSARQKIVGLITVTGGMGSHAAALARSYGIPAIGLEPKQMVHIKNGTMILVDGHSGHTFVKPSKNILSEYQHEKEEFDNYKSGVDRLALTESKTKDNNLIHIYANCGTMADVRQAVEYGADGIGLFRTELLFYIYGRFPTEEEQFQIYKDIFTSIKERPITIRTLDIGGDKILPYFVIPKEMNPFLGWRSLKISFEKPQIFKDQIKAILRAAKYGKGRILFPMVSSYNDMVKAREYVALCASELETQGFEFERNISCGAMIEVPAAIFCLEDILEEADFVTIGTNDLIQHLLAVDRNNPKVSPFYLPHHPSVLSAISEIIRKANLAEKPISLCGEMAMNPYYTLLLIGFGLKELSMAPLYIPIIKDMIRHIDFHEARDFVNELKKRRDSTDILESLREKTRFLYPEVRKILK